MAIGVVLMIKVLLFANLRELAGTNELEFRGDDISCVRDLLERIIELHPALKTILVDESAMISVNQKYSGWDAFVKSGDEVGILPPVSGG